MDEAEREKDCRCQQVGLAPMGDIGCFWEPGEHENGPETVGTGRRARSSWLWVCHEARALGEEQRLSTLACHGTGAEEIACRVRRENGEGEAKAKAGGKP